MNEKQEALRGQLQETVDAAALLLDEEVYTSASYRNLVIALGCAKVVLEQEGADADVLREVLEALCDTVDAMVAILPEPEVKPRKSALLKQLSPYLLGAAAMGGLLLGGRWLLKKADTSKVDTRVKW